VSAGDKTSSIILHKNAGPPKLVIGLVVVSRRKYVVVHGLPLSLLLLPLHDLLLGGRQLLLNTPQLLTNNLKFNAGGLPFFLGRLSSDLALLCIFFGGNDDIVLF
jgi:hypothetical protein